MAKQKDDIVYLNPKLVLRELIKTLPVGSTEQDSHALIALWSFSYQFITEEQIKNGTIYLTGTASLGQLAEFCCISIRGMQKRLAHLKKIGVVTWKRTQYGLNFQIGTEAPDSDSEDQAEQDRGTLGLPYREPRYIQNKGLKTATGGAQVVHEPGTREARVNSDSQSGTEEIQSGTRNAQSGTRGFQSGTRVPPLSLNCLSVEKQLATADAAEKRTGETNQDQKPRGSSVTSNFETDSPGIGQGHVPVKVKPPVKSTKVTIETFPNGHPFPADWLNLSESVKRQMIKENRKQAQTPGSVRPPRVISKLVDKKAAEDPLALTAADMKMLRSSKSQREADRDWEEMVEGKQYD